MLGQYTQDSMPSLASLSAPAPAQPQLEITNCDLEATGTGELSLSGAGMAHFEQPGVMGFGGLTSLPAQDMTNYFESLTTNGTSEELTLMQSPMGLGHGGLEVHNTNGKRIFDKLKWEFRKAYSKRPDLFRKIGWGLMFLGMIMPFPSSDSGAKDKKEMERA